METDALETCGATVIGGRLFAASRKELRHAADILRGTRESAVVVLASEDEETIHLLIAVTDDLISRGVHASQLVGELAARLGGRGGGRPHIAEAGAKAGEMGNRILNDLPAVLAGMVEKVLCS